MSVHEQREGGPLGQTVGSLQLILTVSGTDLGMVCFPPSHIWSRGSNFSHFQEVPESSSPSLQRLF